MLNRGFHCTVKHFGNLFSNSSNASRPLWHRPSASTSNRLNSTFGNFNTHRSNNSSQMHSHKWTRIKPDSSHSQRCVINQIEASFALFIYALRCCSSAYLWKQWFVMLKVFLIVNALNKRWNLKNDCFAGRLF